MFEIESGIKPPRTGVMKARRNAKVTAAFEAYADAYRTVYGMRPSSYTWDGSFMHIDGSAGVSLKRLAEMTRQLKFRRS